MDSGSASRKSGQKPGKPIEGVHYYMEGGFLVFTATYHKERGYCCKSGCRHCPYGFRKNHDDKPMSEGKTTDREDGKTLPDAQSQN